MRSFFCWLSCVVSLFAAEFSSPEYATSQNVPECVKTAAFQSRFSMRRGYRLEGKLAELATDAKLRFDVNQTIQEHFHEQTLLPERKACLERNEPFRFVVRIQPGVPLGFFLDDAFWGLEIVSDGSPQAELVAASVNHVKGFVPSKNRVCVLSGTFVKIPDADFDADFVTETMLERATVDCREQTTLGIGPMEYAEVWISPDFRFTRKEAVRTLERFVRRGGKTVTLPHPF
ncbi:MAG: hypothetical protein Q4D98_00145 [Planctomycetia bacterium]|nr:hypothetical protein [Planctomycetia bacterium]